MEEEFEVISKVNDKLIEYLNYKIKCEELQQKINKAIEYLSFIIKRFEEIEDKELITNRVVDIEFVYKLLEILGGE